MFDKIYNGCHRGLISMILSNVCGSLYHSEDDGSFLIYAVVLLVYSISEFVKGYKE